MRNRKYQIAAATVTLLLWCSITSAQSQADSSKTRQTTCSLALAQAPELRSFRLGMSVEQVTARFPGLSIQPADTIGIAQTRLRFFERESSSLSGLSNNDVMNDYYTGTAEINRTKFPGFDNINSVRLSFLDSKIYSINIEYDDKIKWKSVDEFTARVSDALNLQGVWEIGVKLVEYAPVNTKTLTCAGFKVTAQMNSVLNSAGVALEDLAALRTIEQRTKSNQDGQRQREEERRRVFKP